MTLNDRTTLFASLFLPIRSNPALAQRVQAFVHGRTGGKKLPEFLGNGAADDVKTKLLDDLIEILKNKEYDRLPAAPNGQAAPTGDAGAPPAKVTVTLTPAPAPVPAALPAPTTKLSEPIPGCFVQTPEPKAAPQPPIVDAESYEEEDDEPQVVPPPVAAVPVADPAAALAALIRQMIPQAAPVAPAVPTLNADQIRALVRHELADALIILAGALKGGAK